MAYALRMMRLQLPEGEFKAFLFDCDGTIADSMPLHFVAWKQALAERGCEITEELFYAWGGRPVADVIESLNERDGLAMPVEAVAERKEGLYYELLHELKAVPEVLEHIVASQGRIPFAVVSGSTRESVCRTLDVLGLTARFDTLVCAGDYERGKPDPEPFLIAAERLGVVPEDCLVFEDAEAGIQAAKAAGMAWVRVPLPWERKNVAEEHLNALESELKTQ
jgi:HAD superfamily hydrolase (TIGR01509 family)